MDEKSKIKQPRVHDLLEWQSLSHSSTNYSKQMFVSLGGLVTLLTLLFILFQEWLAIAVSWAAYFLFFALTRVPQVMVDHKITTEGIISMGHSYLWMSMGPFWFKKNEKETVLHIAGKNFLGHLAILIDPQTQEKITEILAEYLPYIEVPEKSNTEKLTDWFTKNFSSKK